MSQTWQSRMRDHLREHRISQAAAGELVDRGPAIVSHWLNGRREINLSEFFLLCSKVGADPRFILFGTDDTLKKIAALVSSPQNPSYQAFERKLATLPKKNKTTTR